MLHRFSALGDLLRSRKLLDRAYSFRAWTSRGEFKGFEYREQITLAGSRQVTTPTQCPVTNGQKVAPTGNRNDRIHYHSC